MNSGIFFVARYSITGKNMGFRLHAVLPLGQISPFG